MKTFTFVCEEHKEYGMLGWRIKSQPDFDPLLGMAVAHDCLEHFTDSANPADEFLALGASMWVRGESYYAGKGKIETNPGVHIASDLPEIMRHVVHEGYTLPSAPITRATSSDVEEYIDAMLQSYRKELQYEADTELELSAETERSIRSYLRIGYRRAIQRYGNRHWNTLTLFNKIEEGADKYLSMSAEGAELTVRVDFKNLTVTIEWKEYPYDPYE